MTAANADQLLAEYPHRKALALRWTVALQSPGMDDMPKSQSVDNRIEDKLVGHLADKEFCAKVEYIVNTAMEMVARDPNWAKIIKLAYMTNGGLDATAVMERLGYEHSAYYEARKDALCAFAELWPPFPSELVVKA